MLRKTSEQIPPQSEPMNLDEFINNENVGTPAGLALTPTPETTKQSDESRASHTTASAIPIKNRKESAQHLVPQSVPVAVHHQNEFGYVPRHPRKTSIDETSRRVSWRPPTPYLIPHGCPSFIFWCRAVPDCRGVLSTADNP